MKITIELTDEQIDKLKYIMKYCGDIWEHDIFFQSEEMHDLAKIINESIDNAHTKDINDKNS